MNTLTSNLQGTKRRIQNPVEHLRKSVLQTELTTKACFFANGTTLDTWQGSEYAFETYSVIRSDS